MSQLTHVCEGCRRKTELYYSRDTDEYLCDECMEYLAEAQAIVNEMEDDYADRAEWKGRL